MYVYVNGYGLRPFRATEKAEYNEGIPPQLRGQYKLPKGIRRMDESKWIDLDYWFTLDQIINDEDVEELI